MTDSGRCECRHPSERRLGKLLELIEVWVEKGEMEIVGDPLRCPELRIGFVATHDEASYLLLEVGETVRVAEGR